MHRTTVTLEDRKFLSDNRRVDSTVNTLSDIGLTRDDSSHAQRIAEHQDLIPEVVEEAKKRGDLPTKRNSSVSP